MGEYKAIEALSATTKLRLTPLFEVKEIKFQCDEKKPVPTIDEHLAGFVENLAAKWGTGRCFVDTFRIAGAPLTSDGLHPLFYILSKLSQKKCRVVPVLRLTCDSLDVSALVQSKSLGVDGACVRIGLSEAHEPNLSTKVMAMLHTIHETPKSCDLVLDLGAPPNFTPIDGFGELIEDLVSKLPDINDWKTFTLLGTSFPNSMAPIKDSVTVIPRSEWILFKKLTALFTVKGLRQPTFGDYAVSPPSASEIDMRFAKPSAKIRYTIEDSWVVYKGKSLRKYGHSQYRDLSRALQKSEHFLGKNFSHGDAYVVKCACGGSPGSLTTWVEVDTNHHIEKVIVDLAKFFETSSTL